jgi:hypothetical protein
MSCKYIQRNSVSLSLQDAVGYTLFEDPMTTDHETPLIFSSLDTIRRPFFACLAGSLAMSWLLAISPQAFLLLICIVPGPVFIRVLVRLLNHRHGSLPLHAETALDLDTPIR